MHRVATTITRARRQGARLISYIGLAIAGSALLVNPLTLRWRRGLDAVNYSDVVWSYIFWAIVLGAVGYGLSRKIRKGKSWADGASLLYVLGAGIIMLITVLQSIGLGDKVEAGIALILGVDRLLDMLRTVVNVSGDLSCAAFVARTEGELRDPESFDPDAVEAAAR